MWNYRARLTNGHIPESEKSGAGENGESSEFSETFRNFVIAKTQLILVPIMATIKRRGVYYAFNRVKTIDPDDCRKRLKGHSRFSTFPIARPEFFTRQTTTGFPFFRRVKHGVTIHFQ